MHNLSAFKDELGKINWAGMRGDYRQNLMLYYAVLLLVLCPLYLAL